MREQSPLSNAPIVLLAVMVVWGWQRRLLDKETIFHNRPYNVKTVSYVMFQKVHHTLALAPIQIMLAKRMVEDRTRERR